MFEVAAAVAREAAARPTRASIDSAAANTLFDAGMVAGRGSNRLRTVPQPLSGDIILHEA